MGAPEPIFLPPLRDVLTTHGLAAKKSLGQHFLLDLNITRKIVRCAAVSGGDVVFEIGPGPGGLTRALLETGARVIAIEKDVRCLDALHGLHDFFPGRLTVCAADAMNVDEAGLLENLIPAGEVPAGKTPPVVKIVANLPYNISTALLIKWLVVETPFWQSLTLMFQKEVAQRIVAKPHSKAYGRLSVMAQAAACPEPGFELPARAFTPPPKVDSAIVRLERAQDPTVPLKALEEVTAAAFSQRRKMLRTSLKAVFGADTTAVVTAVGLPVTARAEEIDVAGFVKLARHLERIHKSENR